MMLDCVLGMPVGMVFVSIAQRPSVQFDLMIVDWEAERFCLCHA
jgi:hypothetical protein